MTKQVEEATPGKQLQPERATTGIGIDTLHQSEHNKTRVQACSHIPVVETGGD